MAPYTLTYWGPMTQICVHNLTIIDSDNGLAPTNIANWTLRDKLQWKFNWNSYIFIQESTFENVVLKMAVILSRLQCVNTVSSLWLNYVPRKIPDVRSRCALYTNMRRFIYCMLHIIYEWSASITIRSVSIAYLSYCYNLQIQYISLILKFQTTF